MRHDIVRLGLALSAASLITFSPSIHAGWEGDYSIPRGCNLPVQQVERLDSSRAVLLGGFSVCGDAVAPKMVGYNFSTGAFYTLGVGLGTHPDELPLFEPNVAESDGAGKVYLARIDASSRLMLARVGSDNVLEWIVQSGGPTLTGSPVDMDFAADGTLYIATGRGVLRATPGTPWTFSSLGATNLFPGTGQIRAVAFDRERSVPVVGGSFQSIAGVTAHNLAHWNGTSWQPLNAPLDGTGLDGTVHALRSVPVANGGLSAGLYVGGEFEGGVNDVLDLFNIARYNGFGYNAVGATLNTRGLRGGPVRDIRLNQAGTRLLIAGGFHTAGVSQVVNGVAQWDGGNWLGLDDVGAGLGIDPLPTTLTEVNGRILVGGDLANSGTLQVNHGAFYQSGGWRTLGSDAGSGMTSRSFFGTRSNMPAPLLSGDAYFLGELTRVGLQPTSNGVLWDADLDAARAVAPASASIPDFTVGCADPGDRVVHLFAAGSAPFATAGITGPHAVLDVDTMSLAQGSGLAADRCVVSRVTGVVYTSRFDSGTGTTQIRAFNPAAGVSTPIGQATGTVAAMGFDDARLVLYIGGLLSNVSGVGAANAARYDVGAAAWSSLGGPEAGFGLNDQVTTIGIDSGRSDFVYFGGRFSSAGGFAQPAVARWNAASSAWVPMADFCAAIDGACPSLLVELDSMLPVDADTVIVAGDFASTDGGRSLLAFDGSDWGDAFDGGVFNIRGESGDVRQLHLDDDLLVVSGQFVGTGREADSRAASGLAVFRISSDPPVPGEPLIFRDGLE